MKFPLRAAGVGLLITAFASLPVALLSTPASARTRAPTWSVVSNPNTISLAGVSCVSSTFCMAVGGLSSTEAERWNGTSWSIVASQNVTTNDSFSGVACTSPTFCMAVGYSSQNPEPSPTSALAELWNGTMWTVVPVPTAPGNSFLEGISCVSATRCTAVGQNDGGTLVLTWNGASWSIVPSPNGGGRLYGVSCISTTFCAAVGFSGSQAVTELWNGSSWSLVPNPETSFSGLSGVSCVSPSFCEAVGVGGGGPLIRWNGKAWRTVRTGHLRVPYGDTLYLQGISCPKRSHCVAVGSINHGGSSTPDSTYVATLRNGRWSEVTTANSPGSALNGVSCVSPTMCTAVGATGTLPNTTSFIESST